MKAGLRAAPLIPTPLLLVLSGTVFGQQPEPPLPDDSFVHLGAALEQLAESKIRKANRTLGMMKPGGKGSLREILISLINGYSEFGRHLPNQILATSRSERFRKKALWHAKQGRVTDREYQQALALIRKFLHALDADRAAPMARSLICNLRMFSGDKSTDGEPVGHMTGEVHHPERINFPVGAFTDAARRARVNGIIISRIVVDSEGCVVSAKILKGLPYGLDQSMIEAFRWWSFEPARLDGKPIAVYYDTTTTYAIQ